MIEIGWEQRIYPAAKIAIVVDALAAEGVPVADALRKTSLSPSELRSPATLVSVNQVIESYRNAIRLSRAPHFAFETGLKTHVSSYGMYGFAILSSMNFRETMHFAVKYHQLATPVVKLQFREEVGRAVLDDRSAAASGGRRSPLPFHCRNAVRRPCLAPPRRHGVGILSLGASGDIRCARTGGTIQKSAWMPGHFLDSREIASSMTRTG